MNAKRIILQILLGIGLFFSFSKSEAQFNIENYYENMPHLTVYDTTAFDAILDEHDMWLREGTLNAANDTFIHFYFGIFSKSDCDSFVRIGEVNQITLQQPFGGYYSFIPGTYETHQRGILTSIQGGVANPGDTICMLDHRMDSVFLCFTLDSLLLDISLQGNTYQILPYFDPHDISTIHIGNDYFTVLIEEVNVPYYPFLPGDSTLINWEITQPCVYINGVRTAVDETIWRNMDPHPNAISGSNFVAPHFNRISAPIENGNGFDFALSYRHPGAIAHYHYDIPTQSISLIRMLGELDTLYMPPAMHDSLNFVTWNDTSRMMKYNHGADFVTVGDTTFYATYNNGGGAWNDVAHFDIYAVVDTMAFLHRRISTEYCSQRVGDTQIITGSDGLPYVSFSRGFEGVCQTGFNPLEWLHDSVSQDVEEVTIMDLNGNLVATMNPPAFRQQTNAMFRFIKKQNFETTDILLDVNNGTSQLQNPDVDYWVFDSDTTWGDTYVYPSLITDVCQLDSLYGIHESQHIFHRLMHYQILNPIGISEIGNFSSLVYPNPFDGAFQLETTSGGLLSVYSSEGKLIFEQEMQSGTSTISAVQWDKGIYFGVFQSESEQKVFRLLKY